MRPLLFASLALGLTLAACDTAAPSDTADVLVDEIAASVASDAVGFETAGALDLASPGVLLTFGAAHAGHGAGDGANGACDAESDYDAASGTTTTTVTCARGDEAGPAYARATRTTTRRFTDASGAAQQTAEGAASLAFAIVDGTSIRVTPRATREVTSTSGAFTTTGLGGESATTNGTFARTGSTSFTGREGARRDVEYALSLTLADVVGPIRPAARASWHRAVSGTIRGTITATITATAADGTTTTREATREISIDLSERDTRGHTMRIGDRTFRADLTAGTAFGGAF